MASSKPKVEGMQALSTNNFIAVVALVTLVIVIVSSVAIKSLIGQVLLNNKVIGKKSIAADQLQTNLNNIPTLKGNFDNLGAKAKLIDDSLPSKPNFPQLVASLEVLAGTSGVKLRSVTPQEIPGQTAGLGEIGPLAKAKFAMTADGSYDNLLKFYGNLELSSRMIKVLGISITGPTNAQNAQIQAETYYQGHADLAPKFEDIQ